MNVSPTSLLVPNPSEKVSASSPRGGNLARLQPDSAGLFYSNRPRPMRFPFPLLGGRAGGNILALGAARTIPNNAARPPCAAFAGGVLPGVLRPLPNSRNATVRSHAPAVLDGGSQVGSLVAAGAHGMGEGVA